MIHGYAKDEEQFLRPDVGNYDIIQKAWRMRINGSRGKEIAEYINDAGYRACTGHGQNKKHKAKVFNEKTVMEIFREPVYAGVLKFGEHEAVDLCGVYDFTPMITEQEFIEVNNIDLLTPQSRAKRGINKNEFQRKNFLHDVVICDHCDRRMGFHVTNKANGELRGYFVCQRSDCPYWRLKLQSKHNRVRGKVIRDKALEIIESLNYHSKSAYEQFSKEYVSTRLLETKRLKDEIKALQLQKTQLEKQISDHQAVLIDQTISKKQEAVNAFEDAIKKTREQLDVVETSIIEKQESLDALKSSVPSMDRFIELLDTWAVKITQKISLEELDFFLSKLLLNCRIKSGNVASYQLHPPFSSLTKMKDFASGGPEQN